MTGVLTAPSTAVKDPLEGLRPHQRFARLRAQGHLMAMADQLIDAADSPSTEFDWLEIHDEAAAEVMVVIAALEASGHMAEIQEFLNDIYGGVA